MAESANDRVLYVKNMGKMIQDSDYAEQIQQYPKSVYSERHDCSSSGDDDDDDDEND